MNIQGGGVSTSPRWGHDYVDGPIKTAKAAFKNAAEAHAEADRLVRSFQPEKAVDVLGKALDAVSVELSREDEEVLESNIALGRRIMAINMVLCDGCLKV